MSSREERSFNCSHSQLRPADSLEPEEKTKNELLGGRVNLDMAAAAASHL